MHFLVTMSNKTKVKNKTKVENKIREQDSKSEFKYSRSIDPLVSNINNLFIKLNSSVKPFVIDDTLVNKGLDYIANFNRIIVAFDIEFHNVVQHNNDNKTSGFVGVTKNDKQVAPFVREIGIIFLAKDVTNKWNFLGILFVNFSNDYKSSDVIYILSKYATVTDASKKIMMKGDKYFNIQETINKIIQTSNDLQTNDLKNKSQEIKTALKKTFVKNTLSHHDYEVLKVFVGYLSSNTDNFKQTSDNIKNVIKDIPYTITRSALNEDEMIIFNKQMQTYYKDKLVVNRTIRKEDEQDFFNLLTQIDKQTCFLVKGKMDFIALKNSYYALHKKSCPIKFNYVYDIEIFNKLSNDKYGSAQLENTFKGMSKTILYEEHVEDLIEKIQSVITKGSDSEVKAHNPVIDSLYTLAVALTVNINLIKSFE